MLRTELTVAAMNFLARHPSKTSLAYSPLRIQLVCVLLLVLSSAGFAQTYVPLSADHWTTRGLVTFEQRDGRAVIAMQPGDRSKSIPPAEAVLNGVNFHSGTIEFDMEATGGMGAGIVFRRHDEDNFEQIYFRPRPKCGEAVDCLQYAPQVHRVLLWDMYPEYQAAAPLKDDGGWNHVKMVISAHRMNIYVNGVSTPALKVVRLEGGFDDGGIMLTGPGVFSNLTVTPNAVTGLPSQPGEDPTAKDPRYVRSWKISPFVEFSEGSRADLSQAAGPWKPLTAERAGLVNVSRVYGLGLPHPKSSLVWLKTTIGSDRTQEKHVAFGWMREAWVFVNGKLVYADKNLYQPATARKTPDGRISLDNGSFLLSLRKGSNDVVIALANNSFYGWGVQMRLENLDGIHLASK
jgi:hypothetical protein